MRFLSHLTVNTEVKFVEINLKEYLSEKNLNLFLNDVRKNILKEKFKLFYR